MSESTIRWSVYLSRSDNHGEPLPDLRMICRNEAEARREIEKLGATRIGREEIWEKDFEEVGRR